MKYEGQFEGKPVYSDPECPPDQIFMLGNFKSVPPRRSGKLIGIGWHVPTFADSRLYKLRYWVYVQFAEWPPSEPYKFRSIFK